MQQRHGKAWVWKTLSPSHVLAIDYPLLVVQEIGARWNADEVVSIRVEQSSFGRNKIFL